MHVLQCKGRDSPTDSLAQRYCNCERCTTLLCKVSEYQETACLAPHGDLFPIVLVAVKVKSAISKKFFLRPPLLSAQ